MRRLFLIAVCGLTVLSAIFLFSSLAPSSSAQKESARGNDVSRTEFAKGKRMPVDKIGIQRLRQKTRNSAKVDINEATGAANFVRLQTLKNTDLSSAQKTSDFQEKTEKFFAEHGSIFGIKNPEAELRVEKEMPDAAGGKHQDYQQVYQGVPVFAGVLKTHYNKENKLYAVNGTFVPEIEVDVNPVFTTNDAAATAIANVTAEKGEYGLFAKDAKLYVYRTGLIQGISGNDFLTWKIEVTNNENVREFVFVDARTNKIVDQFTGIHEAVNRRAYNGNFLAQNQVSTFYPATPFWIEGQTFPTGTAEADNMLFASKETYDLFMNAFGRNSFSDDGKIMDSIYNRGYSCPNASWNGTFISFCNGLTNDDVTAHEWGHAYTEYTHNLIYAWQPGALNESYSDIIGETVDRINNRDTVGNSATDPLRTTACSTGGNNTRWLMGEDSTGEITGALRDMYNPNCFADPGKVSDSSYTCSTGDNGGVHTNSGVPNHAYALIVDGGTYNEQTITGIGITKAAHIYFRAMSVYQRLDSNFVDHANAIEQSATDLKGINLKDLVTGVLSGQVITDADIAEVKKAMLAVEMRTPPVKCNFQPLLAKNPPAEATCDTGFTRTNIFTNNFEGSVDGWTVDKVDTTSGTFALQNWGVASILPGGATGKALYASDPDQGDCTAANDQSGVRYVKSPVIQMPTGTVSSPILSFDHWISTENLYDGGQLLYSVNGGPFVLVPQSNFLYNSHPKNFAAAPGNTNPRAGQRAWTGADGGSVSGSWGKTMINLAGLVSAGQTIQLRWDMSTDGCGGTFGWYVDNVNLNACLVSQPSATVTVRGRVTIGTQGVTRARVQLSSSTGQVLQAMTDSQGNYQFNSVETNKTYTGRVKAAKRYVFTAQQITPSANIDNLNFVGTLR